jgi:hypothetical protein
VSRPRPGQYHPIESTHIPGDWRSAQIEATFQAALADIKRKRLFTLEDGIQRRSNLPNRIALRPGTWKPV